MAIVLVVGLIVAVCLGLFGFAWTIEERGLGPHDPGVKVAVALKAAGVLALGALFLFAVAETPGLVFGAVVLAALAWYVRAWAREFSFLMALRDDDFPGRYDKPIWAAVLALAGPPGLWLFQAHRAAHWPEPAADFRRKPAPEPAADLA